MDISLQNAIITELHNLIDYSCESHNEESVDYGSLHRALIKKYFEAESVVIDRGQHKVLLEICTDKEINEISCRDVDVDFNNFNQFLKSCIDEKHASMRFYRNMLRYYHVVEPISA
ncbi:hypothetical protein [Dokdonia sp. Hel_I_53]|uniref:hypothetical protein n=1 Tax=Dokdonia sp. Hel_I_53 TaxID=1566287 RepID=UPI001199A6A3|nr:hypothetical protein [Dokdonia sp. Hel_I_53]TVZ52257.1 hypothetical protein OD90_1427 [Dokdonia sp. Hel_I_53]